MKLKAVSGAARVLTCMAFAAFAHVGCVKGGKDLPASKPASESTPVPALVKTSANATAAETASAPSPKLLLLSSPLRPTLAQHEELLGPVTETNPFDSVPEPSHFAKSERIRLRQSVMLELPRVIAAFELSFPGATFYGLGRDTEMLADLLDGFYRGIGQPNRVRRLGASGVSFVSGMDFNVNYPYLRDFLRGNGWDPKGKPEGNEAPYVVFDISSWREMSQLRQVGRAAYQSWVDDGGKADELYDRFNLIATGFRFPEAFSGDHFDVEAFKSGQRKMAGREGVRAPVYIPTHAFTYTPAWHELFRRFERDANGAVSAQPGPPADASRRMMILWEQHEIRRLTSSPEFLASVQESARAMGYEFPLTRVFKIERKFDPAPAEIPQAFYEKSGRTLRESAADEALEMDFRRSFAALFGQDESFRRARVLYLFEDIMGMRSRGTMTNLVFERLLNRGADFVRLDRDFVTEVLERARAFPGLDARRIEIQIAWGRIVFPGRADRCATSLTESPKPNEGQQK